jgi:dihydrofolate reductase
MGKIVISENITLDGVVQDPAGVEGFGRGGWIGRIGERGRDGAAKVLLDEALGAEAQLFGRRTYEFLAARWPSRSGELADRLNAMPKYVVSSTLKDPDWNNSAVLPGDVIQEVSELKEELDGEIVVAGSIRLVRTLMENDLVDELRTDDLPGRARGRRAPLQRDERPKAGAPRRDPDRRRPRLPHLRVRLKRLARADAPPNEARRLGGHS